MNSVKPTIELHELFNGRITIYQKKDGYRFSIDSILLAHFTAERVYGTIADLGTGSGILPIVLARHKNCKNITGIEIQGTLAELARNNVDLNRCADRVSIIRADIKDIKRYFAAETFDAVVTNPPFFSVGSGRINPDQHNATARHELFGTLSDFLTTAAFLLKPSGKFFAVYLPSRTTDLLSEMRQKKVEPKALQFVHARIDGPATMVLVEGVKGGGKQTSILPPLIVYDTKGNYSKEVTALFNNI